jgi:hypothetical protein
MSMGKALHQMPAPEGRATVGDGEAVSGVVSDEAHLTRRDTGNAGQALLEQALARENMQRAWERVKANKGAAGVDGMDIAQTGRYLTNAWPTIRNQLMAGTYRPSPVRRVGIPKPDGSERELGIPTVVDRLIQQAVLQVLQPLIDPTFQSLVVSVMVKSGTVSFRYNYAIKGRQETLVLGRYGPGGLKLSEAREKLFEAKKSLAAGKSPARQKGAAAARRRAEHTFAQWAEEWLERYSMAGSTRDMRRSVYERDLKGPFGKLKLEEITAEELRALCDRIVARQAPATAVHAREIVMLVFRYARDRGQKVANPADDVRPSSIARFQPRDRALSAEEIGVVFRYLERIAASPTIRLGVKLLLLTLLRKSEMAEGTWGEVNFTERVWTIPAARMKRRNPRQHDATISLLSRSRIQAA